MFEYRPVAAPYPGLRPFEPHESKIFFGREGHTDRLLEILQRERFLAVIGPSGCGKSSLVRAGLLPGLASGALGTGSDWRLALLRPGGQPILALAQALLDPYALGLELVGKGRLPKDSDDVTADVALVAAELRRDSAGLNSLMQAAAARQPEGAAAFNLLVLVDQFEELFIYPKTSSVDADESEVFVDLLLAARAYAASRVHVALTMRTDFLGNCVRFLDLPEAINRAQYLTPRLSRTEMARAIVGPARVFEGDVEPGLVDELIAQVSQDSDQLPILQHALARMWPVAKEKDAAAPLIDGDCAKVVGGVADALNRHANDVFDTFTAEQQALAKVLFRAITERRERGGQDMRRPQALKAIADWTGVDIDALKPVIETYAAPEVSFLHYGRELTDKSVIDLNHEALIRQWQRLRKWVQAEADSVAEYRRLVDTADQWKDGKAALWGTPNLEIALDWRKNEQPNPVWAQRYGGDFELAMQFLEESRRKHVWNSRLRIVLITGFCISILLTGLVTWYIGKQDQKNAELQIDSQTKLAYALFAWSEGQFDLALQEMQPAIETYEMLASKDSTNISYNKALSLIYRKTSDLLWEKGDYARAVDSARKEIIPYTILINQDPKNWKTPLAESYLILAWRELFNRHPQKAINAARQGLNIDPNLNELYANLAHGYLFDNQYEQAKEIYLQHKDALIEKQGRQRTFADIVRDDFQQLRERGLIHPDMEKIEQIIAN